MDLFIVVKVLLISIHEEAEVIDILEGDAGAFGDRVQGIFGDMEVNRHLIAEPFPQE